MSKDKKTLEDALKLLRDLAEFQTIAPIIRDKKEFDETMKKVWTFLNKNE